MNGGGVHLKALHAEEGRAAVAAYLERGFARVNLHLEVTVNQGHGELTASVDMAAIRQALFAGMGKVVERDARRHLQVAAQMGKRIYRGEPRGLA